MNDVKELKGRLEAIAKKLTPKQLRYAIELAKGEGLSREQCYINAGFSPRGALSNAHKIVQRQPKILEYVEVAKLIAMNTAQAELNYTEQQWLADVLEAVDMSLGRTEIRTMFFGEEKVVKQTNLGAFARLAEQLGKKLAIFTENRNIGLTPDNPLATLMQRIQEEAKGRGPIG